MKKISLLSLFIFSCMIAAVAQSNVTQLGGDSVKIDYSSAKEYEIGDPIGVQGVETLDPNVIKLVSGLEAGEKVQVPGDKFSKAIENLWKQNLFGDVRITADRIVGNRIFLSIHVTEKPRLFAFKEEGVKKGEWDDIRAKIKYAHGSVINDSRLQGARQIIKDFYIDKGYRNVKVKYEILDGPSNSKNSRIVKFIINKGDKVKIKDIVFHGNAALTSAQLQRTMKETKKKIWWNIFRSSKFLEDNYEKDKQKIIAKYNSKGYRDAKITRDTVYNSGENRVSVEINVSEGHKYYFRNISWVGNTKYSSKQLNEILKIKKGDVFDQSLLDARLFMNPNGFDISSLYMDDGYLFFQLQPAEILVEHDSIDMELRMNEGKQATINKVTVVGNTKTNDRVIMREIRTKPGQLFRRSDIIRTQRELSQLGYFNPEKLSVNPTPNPQNGTVDIEYVVEEKPSDQIELSGGWGANRIVGTLGVAFNNFSSKNFFKKNAWRPLPSGDGQKLSIRAQSTGIYYQSYNASFTEPWLGGKKPNSLTTSIYHSRQNIPNPANVLEITGFLHITGVSVGLGKRLKWPDDYFVLHQELNYQYYDIQKFNLFSFQTGHANNIFYKLSLSRNSLNAPIWIQSGSQVSLTGQFTPPYSFFNGKNYADITDQERFRFLEYQKYKFTAAWYTNLTGKNSTEGKEAHNLVLYTKVGFGYLTYYNSKTGLTPFDRFFLGGSGLTGYALDGREVIALRGYDDQGLLPVVNGKPVGAPIVAKYTMELRYPISLNPSATIYTLAFAEAGNSWATANEFNPFAVKRSAGVGVRIFLPMFGLLGFDYGWRFDDIDFAAYRPNMARSQFHFTIGFQMGEL